MIALMLRLYKYLFNDTVDKAGVDIILHEIEAKTKTVKRTAFGIDYILIIFTGTTASKHLINELHSMTGGAFVLADEIYVLKNNVFGDMCGELFKAILEHERGHIRDMYVNNVKPWLIILLYELSADMTVSTKSGKLELRRYLQERRQECSIRRYRLTLSIRSLILILNPH